MSRGIGSLQRRVLDAFEQLGGSATVHELVKHLHGNVDPSLYESARRAVRALERRDLVRQYFGRRSRKHVYWLDADGYCTHTSYQDYFGLRAVVEAQEQG